MTDLIRLVLSLTFSGTILSGLVFALSALGRHHLPKSCLYYAWVIVLLRFVLPLSSPITLPAPGQEELSLLVPSYEITASQIQQETAPRADTFLPDSSAPALMQTTQPDPAAFVPTVSLSLEEILLIVWAVGAIAVFVLGVIRYFRFLHHVLPGCHPASPEAQTLLHSLSPRSRLRLVTHPGIVSPIHVGLFRPTIILPERSYAPQRLRTILVHEWVHYRRRDLAVKWFALLVCAVHWFNPVLIPLRRRLHEACEFACDEAVLQRLPQEERLSYGDALLDAAVALQRPLMAVLSFASGSTLRARIVHVAGFRPLRPVTLLGGLAVLCLLSGCAFVAGPMETQPPAASTTSTQGQQEGLSCVGGADAPDRVVTVIANEELQLTEVTRRPWEPAESQGEALTFLNDAKILTKTQMGKIDPELSYSLPDDSVPSDFPTVYASVYTRDYHGEYGESPQTRRETQAAQYAQTLFEAQDTDQPVTESGHVHTRYLNRQDTPEGNFVLSLTASCNGFTFRAEWEEGGTEPYARYPKELSPEDAIVTVREYARKLQLEHRFPDEPIIQYDTQQDSYTLIWQKRVDGLELAAKERNTALLSVKVVHGHIAECCYDPPELYRVQFNAKYAPLNAQQALDHLNYYNQTEDWRGVTLKPHVYTKLTSVTPVLTVQNYISESTQTPEETQLYKDYLMPAWCFSFSTRDVPGYTAYVFVNALTGEVFTGPSGESFSILFG